MLSVIVIWIYMFLTTFLIGYGILGMVTRYTPYRVRHMDSYLICGLVGVTVYAQFFSLFARIGLIANLMLCATGIAVAWCGRQKLCSMLRKEWDDIRGNRLGKRGRMFIMLFLFLLFAYGTSRGIIHYDTSLYHAQSIRWLEEYGAVRGLGNLHLRLAYNSSSFALSALYSMAFLGGQSFHCAAGWLAFLLAAVCLELADSFKEKKLRISDFARVMCVYYLVNIFDEMVSPASDYFMVLLAFYIVIRWLDLLDKKVRDILPYAMLCVLGVFLMTVKLSAALILLLVIFPAYYLIREKWWKEIAAYLLMGIVTALPFFIRNVLISGWLVYPFTQIDLFNVAWKIPKGMADYDAREIQVWGRGYTDVSRYDISVREWLPDWFRALAGSDKLLVAAAAVSVGILLIYGIGMACGLWRKRWDIFLVQITVAGSFLFWLCTSPLMRYGCVYVYLASAVVLGGVYDAIVHGGSQRKDVEGRCAASSGMHVLQIVAEWAAMTGVCLLLVYKGAALGREIVVSHVNDYWITQKDYDNYETLSYEIEGVTFYYPKAGDQVGYDGFPSAPLKTEVKFMGRTVEDGFMSASPGSK